jgi:hypothetical protein
MQQNDNNSRMQGVIQQGGVREIYRQDLDGAAFSLAERKDFQTLNAITRTQYPRRMATRARPDVSPEYRHVLDFGMTAEFDDCSLVILQLPEGGGFQAKKESIQRYDRRVWDAYHKVASLCQGSLSISYLQSSIVDAQMLVVIFGKASMTDSSYSVSRSLPIAFATLKQYERGKLARKYMGPGSRYWQIQDTSLARDYPPGKNHLYVDVVCSAFLASGFGNVILTVLESQPVRRAIEFKYDALALRAVPRVYTYYPSKLGYVRSNGDGRVWPFAIVGSAAMYSKGDWDGVAKRLPFALQNANHLLRSKSTLFDKAGLAAAISPSNIFDGDSPANGYLYTKALGATSQGGGLLPDHVKGRILQSVTNVRTLARAACAARGVKSQAAARTRGDPWFQLVALVAARMRARAPLRFWVKAAGSKDFFSVEYDGERFGAAFEHAGAKGKRTLQKRDAVLRHLQAAVRGPATAVLRASNAVKLDGKRAAGARDAAAVAKVLADAPR